MPQTKEERLIEIHATAMLQFDRIYEALKDEREQCREDRRFYSIVGAQWEGSLGEQFENKPKPEINRVFMAVMRIISEYRNNRMTVDFIPRDDTSSDSMADACDGLFRADELDSVAQAAYDNGFEEACSGGFGAWRLRTEYEDDEDPEDDRQRIRIEPIYEADMSVWFDLDAKNQDKSDAMHCFVIHTRTPQSIEDEYGEIPSTWPEEPYTYDWTSPDVIRIAEYYVVEDKSDMFIVYKGITGDEIKIWKSRTEQERISELEDTGYLVDRQKRVKIQKVHKYILCGNKVLEDCGYVAGDVIPVIPVYGVRLFIDNIERCMGRVRLAKDAQRLFNMQIAKLEEISASSPLSKPIVTPEQMAGNERYWENDAIDNYAYLVLNSVVQADGSFQPQQIQYTKPPEIPQANAAMLQITDQAMRDIFGNPQEAEKIMSNVSGKAIELTKANIDAANFIYFSNLAVALRRTGEVWLKQARDVYVESGRQMKTVDAASDKTSFIKLLSPSKDEKTGGLGYGVDFSNARLDVSVTVGPTSASKRDALVRTLTNVLPLVANDQQAQQVILSMILMNMDGMGDASDYFRNRLVRMGAVKPTEEEAAKLAEEAKKPDAQEQALLGMAEEAQAKAVGERAKVLETVSKVEKIKAETIKALSDVDIESTKAALELAKAATPEAQALQGNVV